MATGRHELKDDIEENFLTCTICMKIYEDPRQLPCFHSFCYNCLKQYIEKTSTRRNTFKCPLCREKTNVPNSGADGFHHNFFVSSLCDTVSKPHENTEKCSTHQMETLRFYCVNCELPVCRDCRMTEHWQKYFGDFLHSYYLSLKDIPIPILPIILEGGCPYISWA